MQPVHLLRRHWGGEEPPPAFPGWRIWEDTRVRADNNVMALFAAARIAKTSIHERADREERRLVGDLYGDDELPYRAGFRLTRTEAVSRLDAGMEDLSRMAIVVAVAAIDELLGDFIKLLRATGHDSSRSEPSIRAYPRNSITSADTPALRSALTRWRCMACSSKSATQ